MKNTKPVNRLFRRFLVLTLGFALACLAHAQPATGEIRGRVYNPAAESYVRDAEVKLEGTTQVTYTEGDGTFQFSNVPAGDATIVVTFSGYNTVRDTFTVVAGQTAVREINLITSEVARPAAKVADKEVIQLEAVTVSSEREGNSKAVMAQRRNMNITTSVSSDIFGDVTDGNVGEFLKYLPGVDLDYVESEARGPRLGGMDGQYVGVAFDGMRTASADANRGGGAASRATSFEGFSITAVDSIEINYTASPEDDADSPAGTVNMKSKRAFNLKNRRIDYNVGANFNGEEFTLRKTQGPGEYKEEKWKPNYQFGYADSFFNQRFGILISGSQANSYTEQHSVTVGYNNSPQKDPTKAGYDPRPLVTRQIDFKDGPKVTRKDAFLLTADWRATERLTLSLNMSYSYYDGEYWNRNFTWVAANDNSNVNNGRSTVGGDGVTTVIATRDPNSTTRNNVATLNNGGGTQAKMVYTRQYAPKFEYRLGSMLIDGALAYSASKNNYDALERGFSRDEGNGVPSSWIATRENPRSAEWSIRQTSGNDWYDLRSFTSTDTRSGGTRVTNEDRTWITEKWTGVLNARTSVPWLQRFPTVLKFGGKWDEETRKNNFYSDMWVWSYVGPGGNTTAVDPVTGANKNTSWGSWANLGPQYLATNPFEMGRTNTLTVYDINGVQGMPPRVNRNAIGQLFRDHPEQFVLMSTPENWYTDYISNARHFRQTISAGYTQADIRLTRKLQTRIGLRLEETETTGRQFDPLSRDDVIAAGYPVNAKSTNGGRPQTVAGMMYQYMSKPMLDRKANYQNWFPSVVVKYQFAPNFDWQSGFNKSIGRPAIDDLTGVWSIDENNQRITIPNTSLKPEYHRKFQSRVAYYFGNRAPGQITASVSQVNSTNFTQQFDLTAEQAGIEDPEFANYTFRTKLNSNTPVRYRNMDLSYSQTLGFLPSPYLRGINVGMTYTRGYADQRRTNLAPHRVTGRLGYSYKRFSSSLGVIWTGAKPESSTYGRYIEEVTKVDLSMSLRLNHWATLYVQGRNITDAADRYYQTPPGGVEGKGGYLRVYEKYGSNWVFGVKGSF